MATIVVNLDKLDHIVTGAEMTVCGLVVPFGTDWVTEAGKKCPTCFPKDAEPQTFDQRPDTQEAEPVEEEPKPTKARASSSKAKKG